MKICRGIMVMALLSSAAYTDERCEVDITPSCNTNCVKSCENCQGEFNYIDETHRSMSGSVLEWADKIDTKISFWLGNVEDNSTRGTPRISYDSDKSLVNQVKIADAFFQNNKYLNETEDVFIRVRTGATFESRYSEDYEFKLSAQIPFSKSRKYLKIFINDVTVDNAKGVLAGDIEDEKLNPNIGVNYFAPEKHGINSRYALGLSGLDPFVSARYNIPIKTNNWLIDPVQIFKYSLDDKFEEETNIYFDRQFKERTLFRLQLHRKTQEILDGMDYALSLQYYWSPKKRTGLGFTQTFFGNTEYHYIVDKYVPTPQIETYGGINNYVTTFTWRTNIWRNWFYCEVRPSVNFHRENDYKPNYAIRLIFDFYFGQYL